MSYSKPEREYHLTIEVMLVGLKIIMAYSVASSMLCFQRNDNIEEIVMFDMLIELFESHKHYF